MAVDPMERVRRITQAGRKQLTNDRGPTSRQRSVDYTAFYRLGTSNLEEWNWTSIPLSKIYQMRSDPMLSFGLQFIKVPLVRAPWYIECEDAQVAAFIDGALREIWHSFVFQYTNCYDFGYAPIIKNFGFSKPSWTYSDPSDSQNPEKKAWDNGNIDAVTWRPFTGVAPEHAMPKWNSNGEFDGFMWSNPGVVAGTFSEDDSYRVPLDRALWATNQKEKVFGSLYGESMLNPAYRYWWSYWFRMALADRAFERHVDPAMVVYFPPDPVIDDETGDELNVRASAISVFEQARSGSTIALPNSHIQDADGKMGEREWNWEQLNSNTDFASLAQSFDYLDVMKLRSLAVPEQALIEGSGGTSSRNVAAQMGDKLFESQYVRMLEIDEHCNRYLIPQLVALNFPEFKGSVRKITRGFASSDIDLSRQLVQLLGQTNPADLNMVNIREILSQYQIPLYTETQVMQRIRETEAAQAERDIAGELNINDIPPAAGPGGDVTDPNVPLKANSDTPPGGSAPGDRGVAMGPGHVSGVTDEWGRYVRPREVIHLTDNNFRHTMQKLYPAMEDQETIEKSLEVQEIWESTFRNAYEDIAGMIASVGLAEPSSEDEKRLMERLEEDFKKGAKAASAVIAYLMLKSGRNTAITLGYAPSELGEFDSATQWSAENLDQLPAKLAETTLEEIKTFLKDTKATTPDEISADFRNKFRNYPVWKSQRVARGESTTAFRMAQILTAKELGTEMLRASDASNGTDFSTDPHCIDRHGKEYTIEEAIDETLNQSHPNCTLHWSPIPTNVAYASEDTENTSWWPSVLRRALKG